jgi:type IV pilus assembly protein PilA
MRPELQAKLLQHLNKKKADEGFTLVELLVVVIIIGILAAIALPSYLNLTASSKQSEGRQNIASLIHAQQSWATENTSFASTFDLLATGVVKGSGSSDTTSSTIYNYEMPAAVIAGNNTSVGMTAASRADVKIKGYAGGVNTYLNAASQQTWASAVCEVAASGTTLPTAVTVSAATLAEASFSTSGGGRKAKVSGDILCNANQNEVKPSGK